MARFLVTQVKDSLGTQKYPPQNSQCEIVPARVRFFKL